MVNNKGPNTQNIPVPRTREGDVLRVIMLRRLGETMGRIKMVKMDYAKMERRMMEACVGEKPRDTEVRKGPDAKSE